MREKPQNKIFTSLLLRSILAVSVSLFATQATPAGHGQSQKVPPLSSYPNCGLRVNELFGNLVDGLGADEFVELKAVCANGEVKLDNVGLYGHKLVILSAKTVEGKSGVILGTISLQNSKLSQNGFFTIGGRDVRDKSMSWADNAVSIRNPSTINILPFFQKTKQQISSDETKVPYAVALLRTRKKSDQAEQKEVQLAPNKAEKPLTPLIERIIKEQIIDLIVYNTHAQVDSCDLFSRIAPEYANSKYILRSYVRQVEKRSTSSQSSSGTSSISGSSNQVPTASSSSSLCSPQSQPSGSSRRRRGTGKKGNMAGQGQKTIDDMLRNQGQRRQQSNTNVGTMQNVQSNVALQSSTRSGTQETSTHGREQSTRASATPSPSQEQQTSTADTIIVKYSISRCTTLMKAFFPSSFKITNPTPNKENDCECGLPVSSFIMESYAPELFHELSMDPTIPAVAAGDEVMEGGCSLSPNMGSLDNDDLTPDGEEIATGPSNKYMNTILSYMHDHDQYFVTTLSLSDQVATVQEEMEKLKAVIDSNEASTVNPSTSRAGVGRSRVTSIVDTNIAEEEQRRNRDYDHMIGLVRQHQSDIVPVDFLENNRASDIKLVEWLEYLPNLNKPKESKFRCRLCHDGAKDPLISKHPPNLAKSEGYLYPNKKDFRDNIRKHLKKELHIAVLAREARKKLERMEKAAEQQQRTAFEQLGSAKQATARMLTTIFAEAKMYMPLSSHPKLMKLFQKLDLHSLGFNHHLDERSAARMLSFISEEYHRLFLTYLTAQDRPMSLLLDTGVDRQGNDFLSVIIQTLEKDKPKEFFYKLIPLGVDVTAQGYINALKDAMDKDMSHFNVPDLWEYMRKNLVAVISDGANTFSGNSNGFGVLLSENLFGAGNKNKLFRVHCSAHRLQLAGRHLVDKTPELQVLENQLKSISTFYNQQHSKNLAHITELSKVVQIPLRRISYIFPPRWCVNAELVLARMMNNLPLLMMDLPAIAADNDFNQNTKAEAGGLANFVSNIDFHAMLYLVADITNNLNFYSAEFQKAGSLLIGKGHYRQNFVNFIDGLKMAYGTYSKKFLSQLHCQKNIHSNFNPVLAGKEVGTAWDKVDKSLRCKWEYDTTKEKLDIQRVQVVGAQTRSQAVVEEAAPGNFNQLRVQILDKLKDELNKYFPENELYRAFDKLHPNYFRETEIRQRIYAADEIEQLAERFSLPRDQTRTEFTDLMFNLVNSGKYEEYSQLSPKVLWPKLLRSTEFTFGPNIRKLIRITLVIPPSSASVERSFSILNHVKSPRRGRLGAARVEDLMRVALNGDDNLDFFPAEKLAVKWGGHDTGNKPYAYKNKRKNVESVDSQANVPSKSMALSTFHEDLAEEDAAQTAKELQESTMEEFEVGIDQEGNAGAVFAFSEDQIPDTPPAEHDLGGADIFRTFVSS